ncbi:hypothetical protein SDC9_113814 [bioreactor metagenome]|uniref:Uncharacterized protein n=1 Tax=bioreactor metagenome TaxID=1076179 RepID=A0A645BQN1_9ZZZZ
MFTGSRIAFEGRTRTVIIFDFPIIIQINLYLIDFRPFDVCIEGTPTLFRHKFPDCPTLKQLHPFLERRITVSNILNILRIVSH